MFGIAQQACAGGQRYKNSPPLAFADLDYGVQTQTFALADGKEVAYADVGSPQRPTVILVHGLGEHIGYWRHNIRALGSRYRVVALDLPGYGKSSKPAEAFTMRGYAATVAALMDHLEVPSAVLVGHSMGGQVSMTFALEYPERVRALVLAAPAGIETFNEGEAAFLVQHTSTASIEAQTEDQIRSNYQNNLFYRWQPGFELLLKERVRLARHPEFKAYAWAVVQGVRAMLSEPVRDRLGKIKAPTLVVFGYQDGLIPNPFLHGGETESVARDAEAAIPGAERVMIDEAGHMLQYERPDRFNAAVLDWLVEKVPPTEVAPPPSGR